MLEPQPPFYRRILEKQQLNPSTLANESRASSSPAFPSNMTLAPRHGAPPSHSRAPIQRRSKRNTIPINPRQTPS